VQAVFQFEHQPQRCASPSAMYRRTLVGHHLQHVRLALARVHREAPGIRWRAVLLLRAHRAAFLPHCQLDRRQVSGAGLDLARVRQRAIGAHRGAPVIRQRLALERRIGHLPRQH